MTWYSAQEAQGDRLLKNEALPSREQSNPPHLFLRQPQNPHEFPHFNRIQFAQF